MAEHDPVSNLLTGRQAYHLEVPGTPAAGALSVVLFTATENMSEPSTVIIMATHPQQLERADFLNKDATFSITQDDGTTRKMSGVIERISVLQTLHDEVTHEFLLISHVGRLAATIRTKIYQHASTPDILAAGLREHSLREHPFSFRLRGIYLDDPNARRSIHTVAADDDVNDVMQATKGTKA